MRDLFFALGVLLAVEGLLLAVAPLRLEALLRFMQDMGADRLRVAGLASAVAGTLLLLLVR